MSRLDHKLEPEGEVRRFEVIAWRREARKAAEAPPALLPAVIAPEPVPAAEPAASPRRKRRSRQYRGAAAIEIDVADVKVTIENGASPATIAAVLDSLKAGS